MALFKLFSQIVDAETKVFMAWDGVESTSFDDVKNFIEGIPEDDSDIDLRINCAGGDVASGWAMYDALRQSGKNITAIVDGQCSSMATCVLLAAPKENRKTQKHARFCIHNPEACRLNVELPTRLTADAIDGMTEQMKSQADQLRDEQKQILDLYVERTGADASVLQSLMDEDIYINAERAKELGFVTEILAPNTAFKSNSNRLTNIMAKDKVQVEETWLKRLLAKAGFSSKEEAKFNDIKLTAADGSEFNVEREDGEPQVGDAASPDGTYTMEDGSIVTITDGVIVSIDAPQQASALTDPSTGNEITPEEAQQLLIDLSAKNAELEEKLKEKEDEAEAYKEEMTAKVEELDHKVSDMAAAVPNDEQKEILDIVAKAGGKAWLDSVGRMTSDGAPKDGMQSKAGNAQPKIGESFLASRKKPIRYRN